MQPITIAIDGYSSCGKSTLARALAKKLNYVFIDSGAMYRGVTLFAIENECIINGIVDKEKLTQKLEQIQLRFASVEEDERKHLFLNGKDVEKQIRSMEVAGYVSEIATIREVREKLVLSQREMGKNGGVVMDGRDIGSVVFPDAELKLFVTASPEVRAERRFKELTEQGRNVTREEVLVNLMERDRIDTSRKESPLIQVKDAIVLDNTNMTPEQQLEFALQKVHELAI
ncbi:(d)CMP kinase [Wandonia haliotis]|uniref:Cytidylate kinase n=1 Tax=Wandonia haliotis TaxID=574963 RepID=A0ABN1MQZ1_9FLAO